jgi:uncharacterized protein YecE (DUF72 family)
MNAGLPAEVRVGCAGWSLPPDIAARAQCARPVWCVFDNTGLGAAAGNAMELLDRLAPRDAKAVDRGES